MSNRSVIFNKTEDSHMKLIKKYINIDSLTDSNIKQHLNKLKTTKNRKPSDNYLISILRTLKKCNTNITKKPHNLNLQSTRVSDEDNETSMITKKVATHVIKEVYDTSKTIVNSMNLRSVIDTHIAILLVTSTSITITDMYNLTVNDLKSLTEHNTLVKNKKIVTNNMFTLAEPKIQELLTKRSNIDNDDIKYNTNYVISCSRNVINKTVKKMCEEATVTFHLDLSHLKSIGINKFKFKNPNLIYRLVAELD